MCKPADATFPLRSVREGTPTRVLLGLAVPSNADEGDIDRLRHTLQRVSEDVASLAALGITWEGVVVCLLVDR